MALCDVNDDNMALAAKEFPNAKRYIDWRKCLDQKDIEAVIVATPDHYHAFITIWAMNRGLHVYCEKPLGECVYEAREVRKVYLAYKNKLATQHGTQRHAIENFDRVAELIRDGAIGDLEQVQAFGSRTHNRTKYLPDEGTPPSTIDWEQWSNAIKGNLKTSCDFDYAGQMIETLMLGLAANRAGKKLEYDSVAGRITNDTAANDYLKKEYRPGWVLNG